MLARVMGDYALKARTFARIKLFNYSTDKIHRAAGKYKKVTKLIVHGFFHIREFMRIGNLRLAFHRCVIMLIVMMNTMMMMMNLIMNIMTMNMMTIVISNMIMTNVITIVVRRWWKKCVDMINVEVADRNCFILRTWKLLLRWHEWAHESARQRRMELVCQENQRALHQMLEEAEVSAKELHELEHARETRIQKAEEEVRSLCYTSVSILRSWVLVIHVDNDRLPKRRKKRRKRSLNSRCGCSSRLIRDSSRTF